MRSHEHYPSFHARNRLPTPLLATSLACAVAENFAMHGPAPYKANGHDVDQYAEVAGESGKEDKERDFPSYGGETATLLHINMGEAAAPTTIMELGEIDRDRGMGSRG